MKYYLAILITLITLSCGTVKKVEKIDVAISKKDTAQTVVVKGIDTVALSKKILKQALQNDIDFTTFSAKVKVEFQDKNDNEQATAFVRMHKDSVIWISLTGALGVEGFRVLIKKDNVVVWNKLKKTVQYRSLQHLSSLTQIPFDFKTLQDLIVGNPIFIDSNVVSYRNKEQETLILMVGDLFKHLITLDNSNYLVKHSKLDDVDASRNRTMDITFSDYEYANGHWFPKQRIISVAENNKLDISMEYKQYKFNEPLTYPFNLPKNIKVK